MRIRRRDHFPRALSLAGLPALALMALAALAAAAPQDPAATDPRGHSHGHPGGGGGQLSFQLHPDVWNTNFPKSQGFVEAFITGDGAASVDLGSIMLSGDSATAAPLAPAATRQEDHHTVARFTMAAAFGLLANPKPGETHTLTLTFTVNGKSAQLTDTVRIVGPGGPGGGGGSLQLRIAPDVWNTNFAHAEGTVAFFITGADSSDIKGIDLKSIQLMGDSTSAAPLSPASVRQEGHHVVARFAMEDAFALLNAPKAGEMHKVTLSFDLNGTATTLSGEVRIVGPS